VHAKKYRYGVVRAFHRPRHRRAVPHRCARCCTTTTSGPTPSCDPA
jgi:hypothetical protein